MKIVWHRITYSEYRITPANQIVGWTKDGGEKNSLTIFLKNKFGI